MLWPETTDRNELGAMTIGGVSLVDLADEFGTPLYLFDAATLDARALEIRHALNAAGSGADAVFAAKALAIPQILKRLNGHGFGIDVVSAGELHVALVSGIDPGDITLHGNNKSRQELAMALEHGIGCIAIDNMHEIDLLQQLVAGRPTPQKALIRVNPGIDVHTHGKIATGVIDSKFGFPVWTGEAARAVDRVLRIPGLELTGYHCHLGSQLFDLDAPVTAADKILAFAGEVHRRTGFSPQVISPGGGMGIAYTPDHEAVSVSGWITRTVDAVSRFAAREGLDTPDVVFEPGRYLVGQAGVAIYEVGARREIPGVRTYVSVDGGMADNIRPTLYDAIYDAEIVNRRMSGTGERVTIAGKYCESGDILIQEIELPRLESGDLLALPAAGAYCIPLASNYNMALKPAVVLVEAGNVALVRRRETVEDLLRTAIMN